PFSILNSPAELETDTFRPVKSLPLNSGTKPSFFAVCVVGDSDRGRLRELPGSDHLVLTNGRVGQIFSSVRRSQHSYLHSILIRTSGLHSRIDEAKQSVLRNKRVIVLGAGIY